MAIPEPNLASAIQNVYDDLNPKFVAGTIRANTITFWQGTIGQFPQSAANNQPIANWIAVIAGFNSQMSATPTTPVFSQLVAYIYRYLVLVLAFQTLGFITVAQATAVLNEFNTAFA